MDLPVGAGDDFDRDADDNVLVQKIASTNLVTHVNENKAFR